MCLPYMRDTMAEALWHWGLLLADNHLQMTVSTVTAPWLEALGSHFLNMKSDCISAKKNPLDWWCNIHGIYYIYEHFHKRIFQRYFRRLFCGCCCFPEGWNDRGNFPSLASFGSMWTILRFCNGPETKGLKQKTAVFSLSAEDEDSTSVSSDKKRCRKENEKKTTLWNTWIDKSFIVLG